MIDDLAPHGGVPIRVARGVRHHRRAPVVADRDVLAGRRREAAVTRDALVAPSRTARRRRQHRSSPRALHDRRRDANANDSQQHDFTSFFDRSPAHYTAARAFTVQQTRHAPLQSATSVEIAPCMTLFFRSRQLRDARPSRNPPTATEIYTDRPAPRATARDGRGADPDRVRLRRCRCPTSPTATLRRASRTRLVHDRASRRPGARLRADSCPLSRKRCGRRNRSRARAYQHVLRRCTLAARRAQPAARAFTEKAYPEDEAVITTTLVTEGLGLADP